MSEAFQNFSFVRWQPRSQLLNVFTRVYDCSRVSSSLYVEGICTCIDTCNSFELFYLKTFQM